MTTPTKFSKSDDKLKKLISRRDLSDSAVKTYDTVFKELYQLFDVTPSDIVRIAKREQRLYIDESNQIDVVPMEERKITKYQFEYYEYLKANNLSKTTLKLKINTFRALLTEYDIEKPKAPEIEISRDRLRDKDLVSWRDIETALSFCNDIRDKAIISMLATTGLRSSDVLTLEIRDLIEACSIYFDENEEQSIDNLLTKNPEDIIPCWELKPVKTEKRFSTLAITFNTPETSVYVWQYLKDRRKKNIENGGDGILEPNDPLFATIRNKKIYSTAIEKLFQNLNEKLGGERDKNGKYGKFRAHALRKLFKTTCRRNITNVVVNSDKTTEIDIVNMFSGHSPDNEPIKRAYEAIEDDNHDSYLRKVYTALVPYLSIKEVEIKDFKTSQYKELEEKNMALEKQLELKSVEMQRELDEQKGYYEKKLQHVESVNSALTSKMETLEAQVLKITNEKNISIIQDYIMDNEIVTEYRLENDILELFLSDIKEKPIMLVSKSYMDELIFRAYDMLPDDEKKDILQLSS